MQKHTQCIVSRVRYFTREAGRLCFFRTVMEVALRVPSQLNVFLLCIPRARYIHRSTTRAEQRRARHGLTIHTLPHF